MSLFAQRHNLLEMAVVNVSIDTEQFLEDLFDHRLKVLGKRNVCARGKDLLVVKQGLDPVHQRFHVFRCAQRDWCLHFHTVCPMIFELASFSTQRQTCALFSFVLPALMIGQEVLVHQSVMDPYNRLIWL